MLLLAVAVVGGLASPASADQQGAAIDLGRIELAETVQGGERYVLPTIRVRNPGTVPTDYRMAAQSVAATNPQLPAGSVTFTPDTFSVEPGRRQAVEIVLHLDGDADLGDYEALLTAQALSIGTGNRVAPAAASQLTFTVTAAVPSDDSRPWLPWLLLPIAALLGAWAMRKRRIRHRSQMARQ